MSKEGGELWATVDQVVTARKKGETAADAAEYLDLQGVVARVGAAAALNREAATASLFTAEIAGEVARNDKQTGAPAQASGTTTLTERGAIPLLFSWAVDYGAIKQESNSTTLTLSTSPYGLLVLGNEDTSDFYKRHKWARALGLSASFLLDDSSAGLNGLEASDFSSFTVKFVIGDRSTRSVAFKESWLDDAYPAFKQAANAERDLQQAVLGNSANSPIMKRLREFEASSGGPRSMVASNLEGVSSVELQEDNRRTKLKAELVQGLEPFLCSEFYEPVLTKTLALGTDVSSAELERLRTEVENLNDANKRLLTKKIEDFQKNEPLFSFGYALNRVDNGSDYSQLRFIGDGLFGDIGAGFQLVVNAWVALNHEPSDALGQEAVRGFGANLSIEQTFSNFLTGGLPGNDAFSTVALGLSAEYARLEDINENVATVQVKLGLPLTGGLTLPVSLSYASRTETSSGDELKFGVGVEFDTEKMLALVGLGAL